MKCPECQTENPESAKCCHECASSFTFTLQKTRKLPSIEKKISQIHRYLPKSFTEKIITQRGRIEGERKQVTVMFRDRESFTPLVKKLGAEKAYSVMDEIYETIIHRVHEFEGEAVNAMTSDRIMALFGASIALEDAPQRALRSDLIKISASLDVKSQDIFPEDLPLAF